MMLSTLKDRGSEMGDCMECDEFDIGVDDHRMGICLMCMTASNWIALNLCVQIYISMMMLTVGVPS